MEIGKSRNLTEGVIWKQLLLFFFPVLLGSFFQRMYNVADAAIVGQFAGKSALAAVETTTNFTHLFLSMFTGISSGATIIISQYYGAGKNREMSDVVHTAFAISLAFGILMSVVGYVFSPLILRLINVPDDIIGMATEYIRIYFLGMTFSLTYNIGSGILRAVGNSRSPFYFLVISSVINIVLDLVFVRAFNWGVAGAAYATIFSQFVSCVLVVLALNRAETSYRLDIKKIRFYGDMVKKILLIGMPIGLQSCMYPISNIILNASINKLQTNAIAAWAISGKLDMAAFMFIESFTMTISTFAAQNFGAGKVDRMRKGVKYTMLLNSIMVIAVSAAVFIWTEPFCRLFVNDTDVIAISVELVRFMSPTYVLFVFGDIMGGVIRGTGETLRPMIITMTCTCIFRILWVLIAVPLNPGIMMVAYCYPITWALTSLVFFIYYRYYMNKKLPLLLADGT